MKPQAKIVLGVLILVLAGLTGYLVSKNSNDAEVDQKVEQANKPESVPSSGSIVDGVKGIVLDEPGTSGVVVTEFMDFECPACAQHTALMSDLLQKYDGVVTFAVRPLPLGMHPNAQPAWKAALAAQEQDKFVPMYKKLFGTQAAWANSDEDKSALFRRYAEELGLDMTAYDAAVKSEAVATTISESLADAEAVGAPGTPTWVLNGKLLEAQTQQDFYDAIDAAVAEAGSGTPAAS